MPEELRRRSRSALFQRMATDLAEPRHLLEIVQQQGRRRRPELSRECVAPRTPTEQTLCALWSQVLGLERLGVHDNFFTLGGDSILAVQVIARARDAGLRLLPTHLFEHQTVAELAAAATRAPAVEVRPVEEPRWSLEPSVQK